MHLQVTKDEAHYSSRYSIETYWYKNPTICSTDKVHMISECMYTNGHNISSCYMVSMEDIIEGTLEMLDENLSFNLIQFPVLRDAFWIQRGCHILIKRTVRAQPQGRCF